MDRVSAETKVDELHEMYQHRSKSSSDSSSGGKPRSRVIAPEKKSVSQNKYGYRDGAKADDEMIEAPPQQKRVDVFCAGNYEL